MAFGNPCDYDSPGFDYLEIQIQVTGLDYVCSLFLFLIIKKKNSIVADLCLK
jgi:hypothetical protein